MRSPVLRPRSGAGLPTRFVFWEPCVSPHKTSFFAALAEALGPGFEVMCVAHDGVPVERQRLGWSAGRVGTDKADLDPSTGGATHQTGFETIVAPSDADIHALVRRHAAASLHVFSGIRWFSTIEKALAEVRRCDVRFAVMSEPRDDAGPKGGVRWLQSWITEGWLRRRVTFVLAIGRHGPSWFRSVGYPATRVFPFAYFLPSPHDGGAAGYLDKVGANRTDRPSRIRPMVEVVYIGRLVEQKGVRYLLPALLALSGRARLTVIGDGALRPVLEEEARRQRIDVRFTGVLPIDVVQRRMQEFDVLVLPSLTKDDGWGAVVSEALLAGTAVVASDRVGASILLDRSENGRMVRPGDGIAIARAITELEYSGALFADARAVRKRWAADRLTAEAGAAYFIDIVRHRFEGSEHPVEFYQ